MNSISKSTFLRIFVILLFAKETKEQDVTIIANTTEADITTLPADVTTTTGNATNSSPAQPSTLPDVTTPVLPNPPPNYPPINTYFVNGENETCILLQAGIQFQVSYINNRNESVSEILGVPDIDQISYDGSCNGNNDTQSIEILFYEGWNLTIIFSETTDGDIEKFYMSSIDLTANLSRELFPDIKETKYIEDISNTFGKTELSASVDGSYQCSSEAIFAFKQQSFQMNTFNLKYAAFQSNITSFSDSGITQCSGDVKTVAYIPIAVGSALGGLIIIVLIAYLIGRRCERKPGYESM